MLTCHYCSVFQTSRNTRKAEAGEGKNKYYVTERHCPFASKYVRNNTEACEDDFIPASYFHCKTYNQRIHILACSGRQTRFYEDCRSCSQGDTVISVIRRLRLLKNSIPETDGEELAEERDEKTPQSKKLLKRKKLIKRK